MDQNVPLAQPGRRKDHRHDGEGTHGAVEATRGHARQVSLNFSQII